MTMISLKRVLMSAVAASVLTLGTLAGSQIASAQSLEDALEEAYRSNPTLQARRAQLRATDETVPQAKAGWRPTVELIGDINALRTKSTSRVTSTDSSRFTSGIELQVTQNVYNGGGTKAAVEGAKADVLAQRADLFAVEQSVLLQGVTAYMNVLRDEAVVELNNQNVARLERQLEATQDRYDAGVATLTDSAQAESRLARSRSDLSAARGDLEVSRSIFEEIIGIAPTNLFRPDLMPDLPEGRDAAKEMAVSNNPAVLTALYNRRAALHSIDQEYADLLPSVDIIGAAGKDWDKASDGSRATTAQLTARLTVPIYQQGFATSQVRQSKMTAGQTLMQIEEARRDVSEQAISAWETYQSVVSTIVAIREEVRAAEIALDGVQQEELVGQRTLLDVLDAEQEVLDAKVSLERAQRDETVARFELVAAIGALTAQDLGLDVPLYDPSRHYNDVKDVFWGVGEDVERIPSDAEAMQVEP